jgi:hypothetical protein
MQTIEQHFNQLLEPYKGQAIENTDKYFRGRKCESLSDALYIAFVWKDTEQGHEYWNELHADACKLRKFVQKKVEL